MTERSQNYFVFDGFRLDPAEKLLWHGESLTDLTPKASDVLLILVKNAGRLVTKEEILQTVWPDSFVEETNLSHHIFRLRKVLGETEERKFIETVPRRGYRFVAPVRTPEQVSQATPVATVASPVARRRSMLAIAAIVFVLILGAGGLLYYRSGAAATPVESSPMPGKTQSISRITSGGKFVAATISPDGKFVAYGQNYTSGEGTLYIRQVETNTERRLLEPADRNFGTINFSPDGTFVYYIAYEPRAPEGALYRVPVIGGSPVKMLDQVKFMFSLSPDGKRAAFYRVDATVKKLRIVDAALDGSGEEKTVVSFDRPGTVISSVPAFSPDGRVISFSTASDNLDFNQPQFSLFTVDLESGEIKKLTDEKWNEIGKTVWLSDGSGLVFPGNRPRKGEQLYVLSYPSGEVRQITDELNYYGNYGMGVTRDGSTIVADLWETQAQLWSVNASGSTAEAEQLTNGISDGSVGLAALPGGQIAYSTRSGEDRDLWLLRERDGLREGIPLTSDASTEVGICAPHDGSFVVFASDRDGSSHLFRMNPDGTNAIQITRGDGYESSPACNPDGTAVLYDSGSSIWKIPPDGGEATRVTDVDCIAPSVSPDGKYFACIQPTSVQIRSATLVVVPIDGGPPVKTFEVIPFGFYYRPVPWTPDGKGLVFTKIEMQIGNLWRQDLTGGQPRKISDFRSEVIFNHAFSHDGKQLIVSRGKVAFNSVILRNFR